MRIISLVPAATEWLTAFGGEGHLVGRSSGCTVSNPDGVPVVSRETEGISTNTACGFPPEHVVTVEGELVEQLHPDLIVVHKSGFSGGPELEFVPPFDTSDVNLLSFDSWTIKRVFDSALKLGNAAGCFREAMQLIAAGEQRVEQLRRRLHLHRGIPAEDLTGVACLIPVDPPVICGYWIPDVLELAGGRAIITRSGSPSVRVSPENILELDPEFLFMLRPRISLEDSKKQCHQFIEEHDLQGMNAVREGRVFFLNDSRLSCHPGPRLYRLIEVLASVIKGDSQLTEELEVQEEEIASL